ncbi:MAG: hypothetical protein ACRCT8_03800 [Lacipirellulaceae bacterium]
MKTTITITDPAATPQGDAMNTPRVALGAALTILTLAGCPAAREHERPNTDTEPAMTSKYNVGYLKDGRFESLGVVAFDEDHRGVLTLNGDGPKARELREAWGGIVGLETVHVRRSEETEDAAGDSVVEYFGVDVPRSSDEFPEALMDHMSGEYGFFATPATSAQ